MSPTHFNPLDHLICLMAPDRLTSVAFWHGHIPFAFTVVDLLRPEVVVELGTQRGDSYFAFCQAVQSLALATRCTCVDTWRGDAQVGAYGEDVFEEFVAYHDRRYAGFSTALRMTFSEAAQRFAAGTIDLLHIDGLHTYEAVHEDFDTWLPKMSPRGVMLFHDTETRTPEFATRGYGVGKFWDEISRRYPSFSFRHSFGLGVLAVGAEADPAVLNLCQAPSAEQDAIRTFFEAVGGRLAAFEGETARLRGELGGLLEHRDSLLWHLEQMTRDRDALRAYLETVEADRERLRGLAAARSAGSSVD